MIHTLAALPPGEELPVPIGEEAPGARAGVNIVERKQPCPHRDSNSDPSTVQPVVRRYTDCALPLLFSLIVWSNKGLSQGGRLREASEERGDGQKEK
jgi:hypothetical protein